MEESWESLREKESSSFYVGPFLLRPDYILESEFFQAGSLCGGWDNGELWNAYAYDILIKWPCIEFLNLCSYYPH